MILSFSIPAMRPMVEAGIRQARGEDVGTARVKRQTIRAVKRGSSPWLKLLGRPQLYDLQLWWKSPRVKGSEPLGEVTCKSAEMIRIRNWESRPQVSYQGVVLRDYALYKLVMADGFDTLDAFRDFFVPKPGDVFNGVLIKW